MTEYLDRLQRLATLFHPGARVVPKTHWVFKPSLMVGRLLGLKLDQCGGVLGPYIGIPEKIDLPTAEELVVHECGHLRQKRALGLWIPGVAPWLGTLFMFLACLLPLPMGLAWFKFRFELEADRGLMAWLRDARNEDPAEVFSFAEERAAEVSGAAYGWAWPKRATLNAYLTAAGAACNRSNV